MPRGELSEMEAAAGRLVAEILGGRAEPRDVPGAPPATVDFDIALPNGSVLALEVTTAADPDTVAEIAAAFGREWRFSELRNDWMIGIGADRGGEPAPIRKLMAEMLPLLVLLESLGQTEIEVRYSPRFRARPAQTPKALHEARIKMFDLGVRQARTWGTPAPGESAQILPTISGGTTSNPGKLNRLVSQCADRKVTKLLAASADERHLFIWIDTSHADAELAFATLPPPESPALPHGIDVVWLAGPTGWPNKVRVWRTHPNGHWTVLSPPNGFDLI